MEKVKYEEAMKKGEVIEVDNSEDEGEAMPEVSLKQLMETCMTLESQCMTENIDDTGVAEEAMELMNHLRRFRG